MTDVKSPVPGSTISDLLRAAVKATAAPEANVEKEIPAPRQWQGARSDVIFRSEWVDGFPTLSMTIDGPLPAIISYSCESEEILKDQADIFDLGFEVARNGDSFSSETIVANSLSLVFFRNYIRHTAMSLNAQIESKSAKIEINQENIRNLARNRKSARAIMTVSDRVYARLCDAVDPYMLAQMETRATSQTDH